MGFIGISIEAYIKIHLKNNPNENPDDLKVSLSRALSDYENGIRCSCGNDIWVIGSAAVGNSCFTCITGESHPTDDYEINSAIKKGDNIKGRKHIDDMNPTKISGYFDDDGYEINPDLIKKPSLCLTCINDDNPNEEILCQMTRHDQKDNEDFICFAFLKK